MNVHDLYIGKGILKTVYIILIILKCEYLLNTWTAGMIAYIPQISAGLNLAVTS